MTLFSRQFSSEDGSLLVVALLILAILTLIGTMAATGSKTEVQIAGNHKLYNIAFQLADSGVYATPKLITASFETGIEQSGPGIAYLGAAGTFYREIMGYDAHDTDRDIRFIIAGDSVDVDVNRIGQETLPGSGAEFASGAEGSGVGSSGGVAILFDMDSLGQGPSSSLSNITAVYRKVVGTPGGL